MNESKSRWRFPVAEELELVFARHAERGSPRSCAAWRAPAAPRARERIARVETAALRAAPARRRRRSARRSETQSSERHAGTTPRVLSRPRDGLSPTRLLNAAGTRPEPAVSVPRLKLTSPAATATAEPELEPPGHVLRVEGVARNAVGRAHADQAGGELVEVGLADQDRARGEQPLDYEGILLCDIRELRASRGGRMAGRVDVVLDRERDAVERQVLRTRGARARRRAPRSSRAGSRWIQTPSSPRRAMRSRIPATVCAGRSDPAA